MAEAIAYRDQTNACFVTEAIHLTLFLTVEQVIMVLHADEFGPAVAFGAELEHGELVGAHAAGSDIADLAALY